MSEKCDNCGNEITTSHVCGDISCTETEPCKFCSPHCEVCARSQGTVCSNANPFGSTIFNETSALLRTGEKLKEIGSELKQSANGFFEEVIWKLLIVRDEIMKRIKELDVAPADFVWREVQTLRKVLELLDRPHRDFDWR